MKFTKNIRVLFLLLLTISLSVAANMVNSFDYLKIQIGEKTMTCTEKNTQENMPGISADLAAKDTIVPRLPVKKTISQEETIPAQRGTDLKDPENWKTDFFYDEKTGTYL